MKKACSKPLRGDIKHAAIVAAGKGLFLKQGFSSTSMDDVAREAGVSKRTVYDHFSSKEALFKSLLKQHWQQVFVAEGELFAEHKTIAQNLKSFANTFLTFLYQPDTIDLFRLLIAENNQFPNLVDEIVTAEKMPFTRALAEFLQRKKSSGELAIKDAKRAAAFFMGLLKECHFWPMMLGLTQQKRLLEPHKLINEV